MTLQQASTTNSTTLSSPKTTTEIETGLDFIINHFDQNRQQLFPRKIQTGRSEGRQIEVFSKQEILFHFKRSGLIDCKINVFPFYTEYHGIQRYPPDLIFIDIDRSNFKDNKSFENALSKILKNINKLLNGSPTVLWSGNGYHVIQPVECSLELEHIREFEKYKNIVPLLSQEFLRFAKNFLSNGKADKNNYPSFRSCLLRIPGSINSKYDKEVKVVQKWNGVRPSIPREFIEEFRTYLIQKKIDEQNKRQKILLKLKKQHNKDITNSGNYYEWIDKRILANPFSDYRKLIINLILAPYLIVIKKLSYEESYQIINQWLKKCDLSGRKLDFNPKTLINTALATAYKKQIPPMSITTMKTNYKDLYNLIIQKCRG